MQFEKQIDWEEMSKRWNKRPTMQEKMRKLMSIFKILFEEDAMFFFKEEDAMWERKLGNDETFFLFFLGRCNAFF